MTDTDSIEALNNAAQVWTTGHIDLMPWLTPTNLVAAKRAFLNGLRAAPQFEYPHLEASVLLQARQAVEWLDGIDVGPWGYVAREDLCSSIAAVEALITRDPDRITSASAAMFGRPDKQLLSTLEDVARREGPDSTQDCSESAAAAAASLRRAVAQLTTEWTVSIEPIAARIDVDSHRRLVRVRPDAEFTSDELRRLVVHEVGCHVQRAVNGGRQRLSFAAHGMGSYLDTEEGLAAWLEQRSGLSDAATLKRYALRFLAAHRCISIGWVELIDELCEHTTPGEAFDIAARVKRGLVDTSVEGGWLKDHVYWSGLAAVSAKLSQDPSLLSLLLSGKFAISQLDAVNWAEEHGFVRRLETITEFNG